ncbi:hypothetical protein GCM10010124_36690 [Pilimelia terevasa]|uniref:Phosphoadenosine phosphosulfate reductase n=1 Tax=Pilimelia terevasa TaxID=53372 RepID=A0A8J3BQF4_9ACTN|nr:hypothetical protein [Pilimelia terevasa]GGK40555.1 hypothetical protein GCM10010124_36690 [Pilimelia terevasa]
MNTTAMTPEASVGKPAINALSLGAGVQSSALLVAACRGLVEKFDVCIFADTGWESITVYQHLLRLERLAAAHHIPVVRVGAGNIRLDALNPASRFASMPLFTLAPNGQRGMARRQCTSSYKISPLKKEVRRRLGYPHPRRVPAAVWAQMAIGISVDEIGRARDSDVRYMRNTFPLLDLGWRRSDCLSYLAENGLADTPRSSCVGCPFHSDDFWADLKSNQPLEWASAVAFDHAIRNGSARATANGHPLRGQFFLHRQRIPLDQVVLRPRAGGEPEQGCGPWTCPATPPAGGGGDAAGDAGRGVA